MWGKQLSGAPRHAAFAALVTLAIAACGSGAHASFNTLLADGIRLLGQGNTTAAGERFQAAIAKKNQSPVAHYDLGVVYQRQGRTQQAQRQYGLAIHYDPGYVPALFNQAGLYANTFPPLAIFYYHRIVHIKPNSPTAYLNLGLVEAGRPQLRKQALRDLAQAVKLDASLRADIPASLRDSLSAAGKH